MKIKLDFVKREIVGEYFLVPVGEAAKKYSGLIAMNEIAAFIWDILPTAEDDQEVITSVLENYEVEREVAEKDVSEFLGKLRDMEII